jgi:hypothetical protein
MAMAVEPRAASPALEYQDFNIDDNDDDHQNELVQLIPKGGRGLTL